MTQAQEPETNRTREPGLDEPPGVPGWVKISVIVVAIMLLVLVVAMLVGGNHGPGRHMGAPIVGASQPAAVNELLADAEHAVW